MPRNSYFHYTSEIRSTLYMYPSTVKSQINMTFGQQQLYTNVRFFVNLKLGSFFAANHFISLQKTVKTSWKSQVPPLETFPKEVDSIIYLHYQYLWGSDAYLDNNLFDGRTVRLFVVYQGTFLRWCSIPSPWHLCHHRHLHLPSWDLRMSCCVSSLHIT